MAREPARAEVVGSLLRPPGLERDESMVQEAIDRVVRQQIDLGLDVVTDGEFRRFMFLDSFWDAVEGFSRTDNPIQFRDARGNTVTWDVQRIESRLNKIDSPAAREVAHLKSITDYPFKVTFPAASLFALPFTFKPGINDHAYEDLDELVEHAIEIEASLVADVIEAGARYVQFDFPAYPYLVDPDWLRAIEDTGWTQEAVLNLALRADQKLRETVPDDVTVGMHMCRGNNQSRYLCEGSLDPIAERLFAELDYDVLLIEWEDPDRMGDFGALRFVPDGGPRVVMGIVSTKRPELEHVEDLLAKMDDASRYLPLERLAISTQCGFASTAMGNELTEDDQWRKLELVSRVAVKLWG